MRFNTILENPVVFGVAALVAGLLLSALYVRHLRPVRQGLALVLCFGVAGLTGGAVYCWILLSDHNLQQGTLFAFVCIFVSGMLNYIMIHSGVESESPSMTVVLHLKQSGPCKKGDILQLLGKMDTSGDRASGLANSVYATTRLGMVTLTPFGRLFLMAIRLVSFVAGARLPGDRGEAG